MRRRRCSVVGRVVARDDLQGASRSMRQLVHIYPCSIAHTAGTSPYGRHGHTCGRHPARMRIRNVDDVIGSRDGAAQGARSVPPRLPGAWPPPPSPTHTLPAVLKAATIPSSSSRHCAACSKAPTSSGREPAASDACSSPTPMWVRGEAPRRPYMRVGGLMSRWPLLGGRWCCHRVRYCTHRREPGRDRGL